MGVRYAGECNLSVIPQLGIFGVARKVCYVESGKRGTKEGNTGRCSFLELK